MQIEREEISRLPNGTRLLEWAVQQKCADYTKEFSFLQKVITAAKISTKDNDKQNGSKSSQETKHPVGIIPALKIVLC